jgi:hypothetical protein
VLGAYKDDYGPVHQQLSGVLLLGSDDAHYERSLFLEESTLFRQHFVMQVVGLLFVVTATTVPSATQTAKVEHIDQVARRALERYHVDLDREGDGNGHGHGCAQHNIHEFAVSAQHYRGQGPEHAAKSIAKRKARGTRRHLQTSTTGSPYSYSNTGDTLQPQSLESTWGPLRVIWKTEFLYPTADNPTPDGDRTCYVVGQWARVQNPSGAEPTDTSGCPEGLCSLCGRDSAEDCWVQCSEQHVLDTSHFAAIQNLLELGAAEIADLFRVENIVGPMVLNAQTTCGGYPPLQSVSDADLVLFVHARPFEEGSSTTAYASACQVDQHGRPISGHVGINPSHQTGGVLTGTFGGVATTVHEIMHAMGFSSGFFGLHKNLLMDEDLNPRGDVSVSEYPFEAYRKDNPPSGSTYRADYISPPRALLAARRFFGCPSLDRLAIEDEGGPGSAGSHWEQMHFLASVMSASGSGEEGAWTNLDSIQYMETTLAFFEDTG